MNKQLPTLLAITAALLTSPLYAAPGELWEVVSKTEMPGMVMPDSTMTVCQQKGAAKDPKQLIQQEGCEITDLKTSGNKTTWKMACDSDEGKMSGTGEITNQADSYQGTAKLSGISQGQAVSMTASYRGKRLGTSCDTSDAPVVAMKGMENMNEMMGMANKQMASAMAEQCEVSNYQVTELISTRFFGPTAACTGKEKFACKVISKEVMRNTDAYVKLAKFDDTSDVAIAKTCNIDMAAATKSICKKVDAGNYEDMLDYCPEAQAFADANKVDTAPPQTTGNTINKVDSAIDTTTSTINSAKKLKGLLGF
jgi:hypothetical protein